MTKYWRYILGGIMALPVVADAQPYIYEDHIAPVVAEYCVRCHNNERARGDLNLERFENNQMAIDALSAWQRSRTRIEAHEMPPPRSPQPSDEQRAMLLEWITGLESADLDCNRIATEESVSWFPGYVMSRRLNRTEYENTIQDLFGVEINIAQLFPSDGAGGEGFDTAGDALYLSAIHTEKYLQAADLVVETILPDGRLASKDLRKKIMPENMRRLQQRLILHDAQKKLVAYQPNAHLEPRDAAARTLRSFIDRAWRRPVSEAEIERLLELFDRGFDRGDGYEQSLKLAIKAALVSPHFIFLAEPEPSEAGVYELSDFPLASRMSYFLWSTMPDEELFDLARQGELKEPRMLQAQVRRMLRDPKAEALGHSFAAQWLGISQLGETIRPDKERFALFDEGLARDMKHETALFFAHIVRENRSLLELLHADYTFANERLAALYEIDGIKGSEMQRVQLADARRGGVLGMASVLTATSQPLRTSPVQRGKWVLEQILGDHVPAPPPDAGTLPEDDKVDDGLTLRERLEIHREVAECASCHARMDPMGFGLEQFDPIGRWREADHEGRAIDAQGELPTGEVFTGPEELKELLLSRKDAFLNNFTRKMLGYALGRNLTRFDRCVVDTALEALAADEYRAEALFVEIVLSYPFRHRYSGGLNEEAES